MNSQNLLADFKKSECIWARTVHNKTDVASQGATTTSQFIDQKLSLEAKDCDENWHEEGDGQCRRLEGLSFARKTLVFEKMEILGEKCTFLAPLLVSSC